MHRVAANAHFSSQFQDFSRGHNHFVLQLPPDGLNSSSAERIRASMTDRSFASVSSIGRFERLLSLGTSAVRLCAMLCLLALPTVISAAQAHAEKLPLPPGTAATLDKIYSFDTDGAIADAKRLQIEQPGHSLGYLLEAEALWWKIFCTSAEFKFGMTDARHRPKLAIDQHYLDLAAKASSIALAGLKNQETAEMQFYAGMGDAFTARLYGLRGENRATARAGVHAREHFLRAIQLNPELVDAEFGLGLYNYYADTLSAIAKLLGFFMGIPGGNKQEGIRQLEHDIAQGLLTPAAARFYLALDLHRYDQQYERALAIIGPLVEKYPSNPIFQLARGDLYAKLGRKEQALACYRAAAAVPVQNGECRVRIQELARASLAAQGVSDSSAKH
jgi:tetratricopeptide (TPR) repeat protein